VAERLQWRYGRLQQVLYVTAEFTLYDADYVLAWDQPDSTRHFMRFSTLGRLYDYLSALEKQFGADGWELLPGDQRAPNQLRPPACETCPIDKPIDVTTRTRTHVHFRCSGCGRTWMVPKPGPRLSITPADVSGVHATE
jgi:hypothetical protein